MTDELKTLKDITIRQGEPEYWNYIHKDELRAEAIKWVKVFMLNDGLDKWRNFMNFFNLTDEDLK